MSGKSWNNPEQVISKSFIRNALVYCESFISRCRHYELMIYKPLLGGQCYFTSCCVFLFPSSMLITHVTATLLVSFQSFNSMCCFCHLLRVWCLTCLGKQKHPEENAAILPQINKSHQWRISVDAADRWLHLWHAKAAPLLHTPVYFTKSYFHALLPSRSVCVSLSCLPSLPLVAVVRWSQNCSVVDAHQRSASDRSRQHERRGCWNKYICNEVRAAAKRVGLSVNPIEL